MRLLWMVVLSIWVGGCASKHVVRCVGALRPINAMPGEAAQSSKKTQAPEAKEQRP